MTHRRSFLKQITLLLPTLGLTELLSLLADRPTLAQPLPPNPQPIRPIPRNLPLTIALDSTLTRIERVDATSAFATLPRITLTPENADYSFSKTTDREALPERYRPASPDLEPDPEESKARYALFYPDQTVITSTVTPEAEAIKKAVTRLKPQLQTLLATKLLRLTENRSTSQLNIRATLEKVTPKKQRILQQETLTPSSPPEATTLPIALSIDNQIQYRLRNADDRPLYFIVLGIDSSGEAIALNLPPEESLIAPSETRILPNTTHNWRVQAPIGLAETYLIFTPTPLTQTYATLQSSLQSSLPPPTTPHITRVPHLLPVVETLLQELHQASASPEPIENYALNVNAWATLRFTYSVA
jgi:hypothetical protein